MLKLNELVFEISPDGYGEWLVHIWPSKEDGYQKSKFISCCSLSVVADLLVNVEKVIDLLNFDESEVLPNE